MVEINNQNISKDEADELYNRIAEVEQELFNNQQQLSYMNEKIQKKSSDPSSKEMRDVQNISQKVAVLENQKQILARNLKAAQKNPVVVKVEQELINLQKLAKASNWREILGVPPSTQAQALSSVAKKSFWKLAKIYHPDKCKEKTITDNDEIIWNAKERSARNEIFKILKQAYDILK